MHKKTAILRPSLLPPWRFPSPLGNTQWGRPDGFQSVLKCNYAQKTAILRPTLLPLWRFSSPLENTQWGWLHGFQSVLKYHQKALWKSYFKVLALFCKKPPMGSIFRVPNPIDNYRLRHMGSTPLTSGLRPKAILCENHRAAQIRVTVFDTWVLHHWILAPSITWLFARSLWCIEGSILPHLHEKRMISCPPRPGKKTW